MADSKEDTIRRGYKAFGEGDMETLRVAVHARRRADASRATTRPPVSTRGSTTSSGSTGSCSSCRAAPFRWTSRA